MWTFCWQHVFLRMFFFGFQDSSSSLERVKYEAILEESLLNALDEDRRSTFPKLAARATMKSETRAYWWLNNAQIEIWLKSGKNRKLMLSTWCDWTNWYFAKKKGRKLKSVGVKSWWKHTAIQFVSSSSTKTIFRGAEYKTRHTFHVFSL